MHLYHFVRRHVSVSMNVNEVFHRVVGANERIVGYVQFI